MLKRHYKLRQSWTKKENLVIHLINGLLLFGWSTAFLIAVTARMRILEHDWLERPDARI